MKHKTGKSAFTIVELLVVIGIIALLMAILIPVLGRARAAGQRVSCQAQLRDIGMMFQMYLNENKQRVPRVNPIPSSNPPLVNAPSIVGVLEPYHKGATKVFSCPADRIVNAGDLPDPVDVRPNDPRWDADTYFEREGTSYEYNIFFNAFAFDMTTGVNKTWVDALADAQRIRNRTPDRLPILYDFDPFHGKPGAANSRNYLYADFSADSERRR